MNVVTIGGVGHLVLSHEAVIGLNDIIRQLCKENKDLRGQVVALTQDHQVMGDHLEEARERERVWRTQVRALRDEVAGLRARMRMLHHYSLDRSRQEVLGGLLQRLRSVPGVVQFGRGNLEDEMGELLYEAVLTRRQYLGLVKVYLNTCQHF
jgi:hypothetical protein